MKTILKEYQILNPLLINIIGKTDFPAGIKDWKKLERNNKTIYLNVLFIPHNTKTVNLAYKSKYNRKRENEVVLLMIINSEQRDEAEKWHYIA